MKQFEELLNGGYVIREVVVKVMGRRREFNSYCFDDAIPLEGALRGLVVGEFFGFAN